MFGAALPELSKMAAHKGRKKRLVPFIAANDLFIRAQLG